VSTFWNRPTCRLFQRDTIFDDLSYGAAEAAVVLELILRFVTLGSVMTSLIAIVVALRAHNRQLGAQVFLNYSDRIHSLRRSFLTETYLSGEALASRALADEERRLVHEAFYLIFEFHALRHYGYVGTSVWRIWEPDIQRLLTSPTFGREWSIMKATFQPHPHFVAWVSHIQQRGATFDQHRPE